MSSIFHVEINGGPEQTIETRSGQYVLAAMAALAQLEYKEERPDGKPGAFIKIWVPNLVPQYGPYYYEWDGYHCIGRP